MVPGLVSTAVAKQTKDRLRRSDALRNDQDARLRNLRRCLDAETWKKVMAEKLYHKVTDLGRNLGRFCTARDNRLALPALRRVRIVGAHVVGRQFSVEVVAAACASVLSLVAMVAGFDKSRR